MQRRVPIVSHAAAGPQAVPCNPTWPCATASPDQNNNCVCTGCVEGYSLDPATSTCEARPACALLLPPPPPSPLRPPPLLLLLLLLMPLLRPPPLLLLLLLRRAQA